MPRDHDHVIAVHLRKRSHSYVNAGARQSANRLLAPNYGAVAK